MKSKNILCGPSIAVVLQLGVLAGFAQTNKYLFSGSETNITLNPGTYIITAYGAPSGCFSKKNRSSGAEMSAEFNFSTSTTLTLLVGGGGFYYAGTVGGGGGGSFIVQASTPLVIAGGGGGSGGQASPGDNGNVSVNGGGGAIWGVYTNGAGGTNGGGGAGGSGISQGGFGSPWTAGGGGGSVDAGNAAASGGGGGGGSIIDLSAIAILAEVSGIASPDDSNNGEIIITAVPTPLVITTHAAFGFTNGAFGFNVVGPAGSNVVIQASTDLQTWIPLQTNLLGSGPLYFSDSQTTVNAQRFYRLKLSP